MSTRLPVKGTHESVVLRFDFTSSGAAQVTVQTMEVSVEMGVGVDPAVSSFVTGSSQVNGAVVLQRIAGGVDGLDYRVECTVTTDTGDTLSLASIVPVRAAI